MQSPLNLDATQMASALLQVMESLKPNTELLFYRDDDAPSMLEVSYPDGTVEVLGLDMPATEMAQIVDTTFEAGSHAAWRPLHMGKPAPITDVLLLQRLNGFSVEEGNTLIRIGWLRHDGKFVATYASDIDGDELELETITHWAPLPAEPVEVRL